MSDKSKPELGIALIGHGGAGRAHALAWQQIARFFPDCPYRICPRVVVGRNRERLAAAAGAWGFADQHDITDLAGALAAIKRSDVQVVDIATPNETHHELALMAIRAGKHVVCAAPLALHAGHARIMHEAARQAKVRTLTYLPYRRLPAVATATDLIRAGRIGEVRQIRASYLHDAFADPLTPGTWRTSARAGGGALAAFGIHLIDLIRHLTGLEFDEVTAQRATFIQRRPTSEAKPGAKPALAPADADDAFSFLARLASGALVTCDVGHATPGRSHQARIEIDGSRGAIAFDLTRLNELRFLSLDEPAQVHGLRTISCQHERHPFAAAYWPDGHGLGVEHAGINTLRDFVLGLKSDAPCRPDFADGVAAHEILNAATQSITDRCWVRIQHTHAIQRPPSATPTIDPKKAGAKAVAISANAAKGAAKAEKTAIKAKKAAKDDDFDDE